MSPTLIAATRVTAIFLIKWPRRIEKVAGKVAFPLTGLKGTSPVPLQTPWTTARCRAGRGAPMLARSRCALDRDDGLATEPVRRTPDCRLLGCEDPSCLDTWRPDIGVNAAAPRAFKRSNKGSSPCRTTSRRSRFSGFANLDALGQSAELAMLIPMPRSLYCCPY